MKANHEKLERLISATFVGAGCAGAEADCVADHLVQSNLAGHDSHGVIRTKAYVEWLRDGKMHAGRTLEVVLDSGALAVVDGRMGTGQWIGRQTMELAIWKCRAEGVALVALRNVGHIGRIGHWAEMAVAAGFVSVHFVNTTGAGMLTVPFGGRERRLSINPLTFGIPVAGGRPVILDIATAVTAEGKLQVARNQGVKVPDGWIMDAKDFYGPPWGAILPFGGYKGYGLCLITEILSGALTGGECSQFGKDRLEQNMLSILIDPVKLGTAETFDAECARFIDFVKSCPPAEENGEVLTPGELEDRNREQRTREGIELDETTWAQICETAESCGVKRELMETVEVAA
jgi:uncharacterized oxidoreductase